MRCGVWGAGPIMREQKRDCCVYFYSIYNHYSTQYATRACDWCGVARHSFLLHHLSTGWHPLSLLTASQRLSPNVVVASFTSCERIVLPYCDPPVSLCPAPQSFFPFWLQYPPPWYPSLSPGYLSMCVCMCVCVCDSSEGGCYYQAHYVLLCISTPTHTYTLRRG